MASKELKEHYEHIIIGGGIVGAGILRDLTLHKQDVLLIDKNDFASQTSSGSSKMLHGGIRYLENFDFFLVFEALKEKRLWLKLASHISEERTFYLPIFKESKWPLFMMRIGLFLYDFLSVFKNNPHKILNSTKTIAALQGIKQTGLKGAGVYSDGVIDDSKLVFDLIFDSCHQGSHAINYHEIIEQKKKDKIYFLTILNKLTGIKSTVTCKKLIFATGPFTDQVMHKLKIPWKNIILPSKGSHIWIDRNSLDLDQAMVIQTKDKRIIFVIPQRGAILVGTTEVMLSEDEVFENIKISDAETEYLLGCINGYFPNAKVSKENIIASFAAVRPLVKKGESASKTSRKHQIYEPQKNTFVIAGGKYTTFRIMAQDLTKKVLKDSNIKYDKTLSLQELKKKSLLSDIHTQKININDLQEIIEKEQVHNLEDLIKRRLSLYSLKQSESESELKSLIEQIDLKSV